MFHLTTNKIHGRSLKDFEKWASESKNVIHPSMVTAVYEKLYKNAQDEYITALAEMVLNDSEIPVMNTTNCHLYNIFNYIDLQWKPCTVGVDGKNVPARLDQRVCEYTDVLQLQIEQIDKLFPKLGDMYEKFEYQRTYLLKYKTQGHIAPHIDSKKAPNHIGTLIVVPQFQKFEGGELVQFSSGKKTVSKCNYLDEVGYFYIPITQRHQVNKVTSGVRYVFQIPVFAVEKKRMIQYKELEGKITEAIAGAPENSCIMYVLGENESVDDELIRENIECILEQKGGWGSVFIEEIDISAKYDEYYYDDNYYKIFNQYKLDGKHRVRSEFNDEGGYDEYKVYPTRVVIVEIE